VQSAILDWAVQGCLEWQQIGLDPPECVLAYTAEYRAENDPIAEWLGDCCELAPLASTPTTALRASYEQWAAANGEKPVNTKTWAAALQARGCEKDRTGAARYWRGIALRDTT